MKFWDLFSDPEIRESEERYQRAAQRAADAAKKLEEAQARLAAVRKQGDLLEAELQLTEKAEALERKLREAAPPITDKPPSIDGHPLRYRYQMAFHPVENAAAVPAIRQACGCPVDVKTDGDFIHLSRDGVLLGGVECGPKAQMIRDFRQAGEPVRAVLAQDGNAFELSFYRDRRKRNAWREQTVTYLLGSQDPGVQANIAFAEPGLELDLDEDPTPGQYVRVYACGRLIGYLPRALSSRHQKEYACLVVYERTESRVTACGNTLSAYVRIFW